MKFINKILAGRDLIMMRLLAILMFSIGLEGSIYANDNVCTPKGSHCEKERCCQGATGSQGSPGITGIPGPDFEQYACLYNNVGQTLLTGDNILFQNQISLSGITYDNTTGLFTLLPGTYSVTYFSVPTNVNLVANGAIVPNAPLGGSVTILTLSNGTNTLGLQAQSNLTLGAAEVNQCVAMITIYQIN